MKSKDEMKKEAQEQIDEVAPVLDAVSELLDENDEVLDKFAGIGAKVLIKCFDKFGDALSEDMIDKMAKKQAFFLGCLWTHLHEDCGFTDMEATQIVAGTRR